MSLGGEESMILRAALLFLSALAVNLPFGAWRARSRRFGPAWFLAVHLPVPLIFLLRWLFSLPLVFVLVSLAAALAGQLLGGWIFRPKSPSQSTQSR